MGKEPVRRHRMVREIMIDKAAFFIIASLLVILIVLVIWLVRATRKPKWHTHCSKCGFEFTARQTQCPECGSSRSITKN